MPLNLALSKSVSKAGSEMTVWLLALTQSLNVTRSDGGIHETWRHIRREIQALKMKLNP